MSASWNIRFSPTTTSDLCIHANKINELRDALLYPKNRLTSDNSWACEILCLTGPAGSGKAITVKAVAEELGFTVRQWLSPSEKIQESFFDFLKYGGKRGGGGGGNAAATGGNDDAGGSQSADNNAAASSMAGGSGFSSLSMTRNPPPTSGSLMSASSSFSRSLSGTSAPSSTLSAPSLGSILILKDFPFTVFQMRQNEFRQKLETVLETVLVGNNRTNRTKIILIGNEEEDLAFRRVFSFAQSSGAKELVRGSDDGNDSNESPLSLRFIHFNSIAPTLLTKGMKRILELADSEVSSAFLSNWAQCGDIRQAVLQLQFYSVSAEERERRRREADAERIRQRNSNQNSNAQKSSPSNDPVQAAVSTIPVGLASRTTSLTRTLSGSSMSGSHTLSGSLSSSGSRSLLSGGPSLRRHDSSMLAAAAAKGQAAGRGLPGMSPTSNFQRSAVPISGSAVQIFSGITTGAVGEEGASNLTSGRGISNKVEAAPTFFHAIGKVLYNKRRTPGCGSSQIERDAMRKRHAGESDGEDFAAEFTNDEPAAKRRKVESSTEIVDLDDNNMEESNSNSGTTKFTSGENSEGILKFFETRTPSVLHSSYRSDSLARATKRNFFGDSGGDDDEMDLRGTENTNFSSNADSNSATNTTSSSFQNTRDRGLFIPGSSSSSFGKKNTKKSATQPAPSKKDLEPRQLSFHESFPKCKRPDHAFSIDSLVELQDPRNFSDFVWTNAPVFCDSIKDYADFMDSFCNTMAGVVVKSEASCGGDNHSFYGGGERGGGGESDDFGFGVGNAGGNNFGGGGADNSSNSFTSSGGFLPDQFPSDNNLRKLNALTDHLAIVDQETTDLICRSYMDCNMHVVKPGQHNLKTIPLAENRLLNGTMVNAIGNNSPGTINGPGQIVANPQKMQQLNFHYQQQMMEMEQQQLRNANSATNQNLPSSFPSSFPSSRPFSQLFQFRRPKMRDVEVYRTRLLDEMLPMTDTLGRADCYPYIELLLQATRGGRPMIAPTWMHRLLFFRKQIDTAASQPSSKFSLEMQYNSDDTSITNPWSFSSTISKNVGSLYSDLQNSNIQFKSSELGPALRGAVNLVEDDIIEDDSDEDVIDLSD